MNSSCWLMVAIAIALPVRGAWVVQGVPLGTPCRGAQGWSSKAYVLAWWVPSSPWYEHHPMVTATVTGGSEVGSSTCHKLEEEKALAHLRRAAAALRSVVKSPRY